MHARAIGLLNPTSSILVRVNYNKGFSEHCSATTGFFVTDASTDGNRYFPNEGDYFSSKDFFRDNNDLFSDMSLNGDNIGFSSGLYVFLPSAYEIMLKFLFLAICLFVAAQYIALSDVSRFVDYLLNVDLHD
jgi:hypothetical protein